MLLANLFRDQLDRYGELEMIADRWAEVVARARRARRSCSTPTTRSSPTSAARAPAPSYFGVDDDALALPELQHAATPSTAAAAGTPTSTSAVYLAHLGRYHCPNCGQRRPEPAVVGPRRRAARHPLGRLHARTAASAASSCRCPASTTSTTRSAPPRSASRSASRSTTSSPGLAGRRARVRPRRDARPRRPPDLDPARQEPGGRERGAAHARARGRRARPARRAQRPHRRRPRRLLGLGRRLGAARRPRAAHDLPRARAPPSWRCG